MFAGRQFSERGVRLVRVTHSDTKFSGISTQISQWAYQDAKEVDRGIAGLLKDLKQRGMLEETLVMWGGEFGRTPVAEQQWSRP